MSVIDLSTHVLAGMQIKLKLATDVDTQQVIVIAKLLVDITWPSFVVWTRYTINLFRLGPVVPIYAYRFHCKQPKICVAWTYDLRIYQ